MGALASKVVMGVEIPDPEGDDTVPVAEAADAFFEIDVIAEGDAPLPEYPDKICSCMHIKAPLPARLDPGAMCVYDTKLSFRVPAMVMLEVKPYERLVQCGVVPAAQVIDSSSVGNLHVVLFNHSGDTYKIAEGDTVAQLCVVPRLISPDLKERPMLHPVRFEDIAKGER